MKTLLSILLTATLFLDATLTSAQTNVSGGIYNNTTWTRTNAPYIVTGNIVLFPGKTLTIEPGVTVRVNSNCNIEIRGTLIAIGNVVDSISFISNTTPTKGAWDYIQILNSSQNASASFEYCSIKHSTEGILVECCWGNSSSYITHCSFDNNITASSYYAGWQLHIDSCSFNDNTVAVSHADKRITNSTFTNNVTGIGCERFEARNCTFENNQGAIDWNVGTSGYAVIDSCIITHNNIGVRIYNGPITNSDISDNNFGVITGHSSSTYMGIPYYVPISNNRICNNTTFNVQNLNSYNKNITHNCFCVNDSTAIETKLKDGYDDITLGLFNYDIWDSTCLVLYRSVFKVGPVPSAAGNLDVSFPELALYPNPFSTHFTTELNTKETGRFSIRIFNTLGQNLQEIKLENAQPEIIDTKNLGSGLYIVQLLKDNTIIGQRKMVKE